MVQQLSTAETHKLDSYMQECESNSLVVNVSEMLRRVEKTEGWRVTIKDFVSNWQSTVPTMPEAVHVQLPNVEEGFVLPSIMDDKQLEEADRRLANLEDYYQNKLLLVQQGRKGLEDASKAIKMLYHR